LNADQYSVEPLEVRGPRRGDGDDVAAAVGRVACALDLAAAREVVELGINFTVAQTRGWRLAADQLDDVAGQAVADLLAQILRGSPAQPGRA